MFNRVFLIVIDALGLGPSIQASNYNDNNANTLQNIINKNEFDYKNFRQLGLYNLLGKENTNTIGFYTTSDFVSKGKSCFASSYEIMGIDTTEEPNLFNDGLPEELLNKIVTVANRKVVGNKPGVGVNIINEYIEDHLKNGTLILYTSPNDSAIKIAAHSNIMSEDELYVLCKKIKEITNEKVEWNVERVVAKPITGYKPHYVFTNTKNIASNPPSKTILNILKNNSFNTITIGKVGEFFNNSGVSKSYKPANDLDALSIIADTIREDFVGLCYANLEDIDRFAFKKDAFGYGKALKIIDDYLPIIINSTKETDIVIITSDHGNDIASSTINHTKEKVPVFIYSKRFVNRGRIDDISTISDIGATIADIFSVNPSDIGNSFLSQIKPR